MEAHRGPTGTTESQDECHAAENAFIQKIKRAAYNGDLDIIKQQLELFPEGDCYSAHFFSQGLQAARHNNRTDVVAAILEKFPLLNNL